MAEPEEVLIEAARHATQATARLWRRLDRERSAEAAARLADHKERLELLIEAVYGQPVPLVAAQAPAPPTALRRLFNRLPRELIESRALPGNDGTRVFLPRQLGQEEAGAEPAHFYRALALQQAGRALRAGGKEPPTSALVADLLQLSEAVAVDYLLARAFPGLVGDLAAVRRATLSRRPQRLNPAERTFEDCYRRVLDSPPAHIPAPLVLAPTRDESLAWAQARARELETSKTPYRGILHGLWLGNALPAPRLHTAWPLAPAADQAPAARPRAATLERRPTVREKREDEDDSGPGMWMLQMDDPQQHVEDPMGMQRPTDRDDQADARELADSLAELPEARLVATPRPAPEVLVSDDPPPRSAVRRSAGLDRAAGIVYPEWDYRSSQYRSHGAIVRIQTPRLGDATWADGVRARRRPLVEAVWRRFAGLRPRRVLKDREPDGAELDLGAYVAAFAERRTGQPLADRLYRAVRPARRDLAIALLVDISGSTDAWVTQDLRIIDVEKEALLIVCHALDALGDAYTIQAFSGEGPECVSLWPLKDFAEPAGGPVERRIAALEPERYTRAGAALRHAGALLAARRAEHRLLLLLSDGRPNDLDHYEGRYGVEDMRQAVAEAILAGIHPFCLTVDRQAPRYLGSVFGPGRYAVLPHAARLPLVLVRLLQRLVRA